MRLNFKTPNHCDRCGRGSIAFTMSRFNTEMLCMTCLQLERQHPDYPAAHEAELAAVKRGEYNFPGVGLPENYPSWAAKQLPEMRAVKSP
jgi:hypothetical protein